MSVESEQDPVGSIDDGGHTPAFDQRQFRNALGTFVTGVTVVTTCDSMGGTHGVTANSFSSVSLDPPLVLWSQALSSRSYSAFRDSDHFAINILADDQIAISNHFAKSREDKFNGIECRTGLGGAPVLVGVAAHFECLKVASFPGGDHVVYVGRVERMGHSNRRALAFGSGRYVTTYAHDLGPVALNLGTSTPSQLEAVRLVTAELPNLAEKLGGHTLCLAVWGNHGPTAIHWEPSSNPVSNQLRVGLVMSITRSATGRAFAAFLPTEHTGVFVDEDLRLSRHADQDEATQRLYFERDVEEARVRGYARVTGVEPSPLHQVAVNAFSVPIFDSHGNMLMALSLTSQASRLDPDWDGPVPSALAEAGWRLSAQIQAASAV